MYSEKRKIAPGTKKVRETLSGAQVSNVLCIYVEIPRTCGASPPQSLFPGRPYCAHCSAHNSVWDTKPRWSPWLCVCACHHTGCRSIYGPYFDDEAFTVQHDRPFRVCMANLGPDTNNSQVSPSGLENKEMEVNTLGTLVQPRNGVRCCCNLPMPISLKMHQWDVIRSYPTVRVLPSMSLSQSRHDAELPC